MPASRVPGGASRAVVTSVDVVAGDAMFGMLPEMEYDDLPYALAKAFVSEPLS